MTFQQIPLRESLIQLESVTKRLVKSEMIWRCSVIFTIKTLWQPLQLTATTRSHKQIMMKFQYDGFFRIH